jgi:Cu(I)/Ag(I) efflux system membrane fusion protein
MNLGMSEAQIKRMADTRQLPENIDVVSPTDGFILSRNVSPGLHFDHGMEFYRIADLEHVWVLAEVDEQEAAYIHAAGAAMVSSSGGRELPAKITESLPQSDIAGGTVKLRLEVSNAGFILRPDMIVDVKIPVHLPPGVTVPADALVNTGARPRVYVESKQGFFEPREVETGWRSGDRVEIRAGIRPGERIVVAATFLVDSESRLKSPAPPSVRQDSQTTLKRANDPNCKIAEGRNFLTDQDTACKDNLSKENLNTPSQTSSLAAKQFSGK